MKNLAERVSQKLGKSKKEVQECLKTAFEEIENIVAEGGHVTVIGFGKFDSKLRKGKEGTVNGKTYRSEDRMVPKFKPGKTFEEKVAKLKPSA